MGRGPDPGPRSGIGARKVVVTGIVIGLVVAGGLGGWIYHLSVTTPVSEPVGDGPAFYQALGAINANVSQVGGGPWALFSIYGIAAQAPFSMGVWGWAGPENVTQNACAAQFNGLTVWNGSLPVFRGDFTSGTAPFWQVAYFSATTQSILLSTDVRGVVHLFAPIPLDSPCGQYGWPTFPSNTSYWVQQLTPLPPNTPLVASLVLPPMNPAWIASQAPLVEVFTSGPGMTTRTGDVAGGTMAVILQGCGLAGITGVTPILFSWLPRDGVPPAAYLNGTTNCSLMYTGNPNPAGNAAYLLALSSPTSNSTNETEWVNSKFQVVETSPNGSGPFYYDGWGLANWMLNFTLYNRTGAPLPSAASGCPEWVPTVRDCAANPNGWYLVLTSPQGAWVASGGAGEGGFNWSVPVVSVVSHQQLVLVLPSGWNTTGDRLVCQSTTSFSVVRGTLNL